MTKYEFRGNGLHKK